jgi:hypoxanthine-DNA glycosylase
VHVPVIRGFDPIIAPGARVLILGTVPSVRSLEVVQYYGHPRNAFWPIMEQLFRSGGGPLGYEERKRLVNSSGVAIWDVLASAERPGSLDAAIVGESVVANDIAGLLGDYTTIHTVFFNGAAAQALFARHVAPPSERELAVEFVRLPSTSPANASLTFEEKLEAWRVVERATASR